MPISKKEKTVYRHILADAWRITWRRKELWLFGFFAAFAWGGGAANYITDLFFRFSSDTGAPFTVSLSYYKLFIEQLSSPASYGSAIVTLIFIVFALALAVFASVVSLGAIMNAAAKFGPNKASNIGQDLRIGIRSFWKIFFINFVCRLIACALVVFVWLGLAGYSYVMAAFSLIYVLIFVVAALASVFLWFVGSVAAAAVAIDDMDWTEALHYAGRLLIKHWLVSIETTAILFLATIAAAAAIVVATIILAVPFTIIIFAASFVKSAIVMGIAILAGTIIAVVLVASVGSALAVFTQATWALLYARLGRNGISAKLERLFAHTKINRRLS